MCRSPTITQQRDHYVIKSGTFSSSSPAASPPVGTEERTLITSPSPVNIWLSCCEQIVHNLEEKQLFADFCNPPPPPTHTPALGGWRESR